MEIADVRPGMVVGVVGGGVFVTGEVIENTTPGMVTNVVRVQTGAGVLYASAANVFEIDVFLRRRSKPHNLHLLDTRFELVTVLANVSAEPTLRPTIKAARVPIAMSFAITVRELSDRVLTARTYEAFVFGGRVKPLMRTLQRGQRVFLEGRLYEGTNDISVEKLTMVGHCAATEEGES